MLSPLFWLDITAYGIAMVGAISLALIVLGAGFMRTRNLFFALFALSEAIWAFCSIFVRLTLWLDMGNPALFLELATVAFVALGFFLLLFTVRYVERPTRWADLSCGIGVAATAVLSIFLFRHQILESPRLVDGGMLYYEVSTWGLLAAVLPVIFIVWSLVLFWLERRRTSTWYLTVGVAILLVGFLIGGLFSPPFPIMSLTTTISIVTLGYSVISRQILNPLRELTTDLERKVAERTQELEQRVAREAEQQKQLQRAKEEIEERMRSEQAQRAQLQQLVEQVRATAGQLGSTAAEMLATATQQASGAAEQSAAMSQALATTAEMRTISERAVERAQGVATLVQQTAHVAQSGQQAVTDSIAGMEQVRQQVEVIASQVAALSEQAETIDQIVTMVMQIAKQSKMLALNAAVEAARAGEGGRGFAVVASEVRSLADQSRTASEQIRDILGEIEQGIAAAATATQEGRQGTDAGVQLTAQAGQSIEQLADGVGESSQAVQRIATEAEEQLVGTEQIVRAIENIQQVATQNVAAAQQMERAAAELNDLAGQLSQEVRGQ